MGQSTFTAFRSAKGLRVGKSSASQGTCTDPCTSPKHRVLLHHSDTHNSSHAQGKLQTFPRPTDTSTGRNLKMLQLLTLLQGWSQTLHGAALPLGLNNEHQTTVCSENKAFPTAPPGCRAQRAPDRGLPPVKTSREPGCQPPGPPLGSRPHLPFTKGREEEDLSAPVGLGPVQQVCSPVPHCYCSHATPRRHIGARPETITISYNNVRAAPEPSQCRQTPCSLGL